MSDQSDGDEVGESITNRQKLRSLYEVATHNPAMTAGILILGLVTAALEGVGLGFILPIVEQTQESGEPSGLVAGFVGGYGMPAFHSYHEFR